MPRPGPRRQFTGAVMTDEQRAALQERADRDGVDMSEVIRRAVDAYLDSDVEGYLQRMQRRRQRR